VRQFIMGITGGLLLGVAMIVGLAITQHPAPASAEGGSPPAQSAQNAEGKGSANAGNGGAPSEAGTGETGGTTGQQSEEPGATESIGGVNTKPGDTPAVIPPRTGENQTGAPATEQGDPAEVGGNSPEGENQAGIAEQSDTTNSNEAAPAALVKQGEELYAQNCAGCHRPNGVGVENQFPPLVKAEQVVGDKQALLNILIKGAQGPMEVGGRSYNGVMPAFGHLSDEQIAAIASYIRTSWENNASGVTPQDVKSAR